MTFHYLHLKEYSIFEQLQLEEALLRNDERNWCIVNEGSSPAIVMGISGKPAELIHSARVLKDQIPVIKRFSGGGTVIVDPNTLFITFICQKELHPFPCYPEPILRWTEKLYQPLFPQGFEVRENDYVMAERKCGGNAQYIKKDRWLHHTSFLWDFSREKMEYLLFPKRTPQYRLGRPHADFLCRLKDCFSDKAGWIQSLKEELAKRYEVKEVPLEDTLAIKNKPHRQETRRLT